MSIEIRKAVEGDSEKLWCLMKELAIFEKYIDSLQLHLKLSEKADFKKLPRIFIAL